MKSLDFSKMEENEGWTHNKVRSEGGNTNNNNNNDVIQNLHTHPLSQHTVVTIGIVLVVLDFLVLHELIYVQIIVLSPLIEIPNNQLPILTIIKFLSNPLVPKRNVPTSYHLRKLIRILTMYSQISIRRTWEIVKDDDDETGIFPFKQNMLSRTKLVVVPKKICCTTTLVLRLTSRTFNPNRIRKSSWIWNTTLNVSIFHTNCFPWKPLPRVFVVVVIVVVVIIVVLLLVGGVTLKRRHSHLSPRCCL
jgi:hypothetical protein